jgi:hypothetical protein
VERSATTGAGDASSDSGGSQPRDPPAERSMWGSTDQVPGHLAISSIRSPRTGLTRPTGPGWSTPVRVGEPFLGENHECNSFGALRDIPVLGIPIGPNDRILSQNSLHHVRRDAHTSLDPPASPRPGVMPSTGM